MSSLHLEIVTPERTVFSQEVTMVIAQTVDGQIGVLPGHIPLVTVLETGVMRVQVDQEQEQKLAVSGGFLEMSPDNKLTILAQTAELADEIDVERARQALARAEARLNGKREGIDIVRAEIAMQKAITRLRAAGDEE
ncbi:MAG TPA: F0F1 ATP synthase subunit epsilon [Firmicutes bacterium]|nr:F0F1 ATP synthase subunit epsilon [Bacillota bacterium]